MCRGCVCFPAGPDGQTPHPFLRELSSLTYPPWQLQPPTSLGPAPSLDSVPFLFVNKPTHLDRLVEDLATSTEVAVDLEHHSERCLHAQLRSVDVIIHHQAINRGPGAPLRKVFVCTIAISRCHYPLSSDQPCNNCNQSGGRPDLAMGGRSFAAVLGNKVLGLGFRSGIHHEH